MKTEIKVTLQMHLKNAQILPEYVWDAVGILEVTLR